MCARVRVCARTRISRNPLRRRFERRPDECETSSLCKRIRNHDRRRIRNKQLELRSVWLCTPFPIRLVAVSTTASQSRKQPIRGRDWRSRHFVFPTHVGRLLRRQRRYIKFQTSATVIPIKWQRYKIVNQHEFVVRHTTMLRWPGILGPASFDGNQAHCRTVTEWQNWNFYAYFSNLFLECFNVPPEPPLLFTSHNQLCIKWAVKGMTVYANVVPNLKC